MKDAVRGFWVRVRSWVFKGAHDRRMDEELQFHLEMETAKLERAGFTPEEAHRRARVAFG